MSTTYRTARKIADPLRNAIPQVEAALQAALKSGDTSFANDASDIRAALHLLRDVFANVEAIVDAA